MVQDMDIVLGSPVEGEPIEISPRSLAPVNNSPCAVVRRSLRDPMFSRFNTIPVCDRQTDDRRTHDDNDDSMCHASIASRGKY